VFSVTGDAPYEDEVAEFQQHLDDHNLYSHAEFFVHVGDIFSGSEACSEFRYQRMADQLRTLAVPAFVVPGDNETVDCVDPGQGWEYWQSHLLGIEAEFCRVPAVERQSGREENFAFVHGGVLFIGIHLVGGSNSSSRLQDNADWAEQQLQQKGGAVRAAVLFAQAGPEHGSSFWDRFVPDAADFAKPVLVAHGNGHEWLLDQPFSQPNMTRLQVDRGNVPFVHVTVGMDSLNPFQFERDPWPSGTPTFNTPVCVDAGDDVSVAGPGTILLQGIVRDDGLIEGPSASWGVVDAAGSVSFGASSSPTSSVTFGAPGTYVLRWSADDGQYSDSDEVSIFVGDQPNDVPVAQDDAYQTDEDVTLSRSAPGLLQNDSDPNGDNLTVSVSVWPTKGSLSVSADGSFSYTPDANDHGSDSFSYNVSDGRGGMDTGHVSIDVLAVNDAPLAVGDAHTTAYSEPLIVGAPGLLLNDSDVEGDSLTASLVSPASHGTMALAPDGSFSYEPDVDFAGWDSFTYAVSDGTVSSAAATVSISVGVTVLTPSDDATVRATQRDRNFGSSSTLELRSSNKPYCSYLKFSVDGVEYVRAARLRLYANGSTGSAGQVHLVSNQYGTSSTAWGEDEITWANAPAMDGNALATAGAVEGGSWVEFDVTEAVRNGVISFGLQNSSSGSVSFSSKEGQYPPQLAIASTPQTANVEMGDPGGLRNALRRVYPNPTRGDTWIEYQLESVANVSVGIFNARGQRVRTLRPTAGTLGTRRVIWDGRDNQGRALASGVYFLRLELGARRFVRKILLER
jgi:hypothetical protein